MSHFDVKLQKKLTSVISTSACWWENVYKIAKVAVDPNDNSLT